MARSDPLFDSSARGRLEFLPKEDIDARQNALLRKHLAYLAERSRFYSAMFAEHGIDPDAVRTAADLPGLPCTVKNDLASRPDDFLCVDRDEVIDYSLTSGTTGEPVAMLQTRQDLDRVGFNEELSFRVAGIGPSDRVLVAATLDRCFMAGLAYFLGLQRLGASVIRGGSSSIAALEELVRRHRPSAIVGVPTLLLELGKRLSADGHEPADAGVRRLVCIGEPIRSADLGLSALGRALQEMWGAAIHGTYASTEMATAFTDCDAGRGGHVQPDLIVVETLDDAGDTTTEPGEVVATPLGVTGMPLLRFKTGDIAKLHVEPCACGRTTPRLGPIVGRKSQMLKVRGTTVYPPAIFGVLQEIDGISGYYLEVFDTYELAEEIRLVVGTASELSAAAIAEKIAARTRVKPQVVLASPTAVREKTVQEGKRKPVTFFDRRNAALDGA